MRLYPFHLQFEPFCFCSYERAFFSSFRKNWHLLQTRLTNKTSSRTCGLVVSIASRYLYNFFFCLFPFVSLPALPSVEKKQQIFKYVLFLLLCRTFGRSVERWVCSESRHQVSTMDFLETRMQIKMTYKL